MAIGGGATTTTTPTMTIGELPSDEASEQSREVNKVHVHGVGVGAKRRHLVMFSLIPACQISSLSHAVVL